jgi:hypothetical protein
MQFNINGCGESFNFRGTINYYNGCDVGISFNIGGTGYTTFNGSGASGDLSNQNKFDTLAITNLTGSANTTGASTTGDGSVVMIYTKTIAGRRYELKRTISYTYPNYYYKDEYDIIIPAGNTATVKLYKGGDTAPGGVDRANDMLSTVPVRDLQSVNPAAGVVIGMKEILQPVNMSTFEGAVGVDYSNPYPDVVAGNDIGFQNNPNTHDAGFMIQYTIGSTPGTYHEENYTYAGFQKINLEASWGTTLPIDVGDTTTLNLTMANAFLTTKTGLGYTFTLPANLTIGATTNSCGGTVTVVGQTISLAGGALNALTNCLVSAVIGSTTPGTYGFTAASATSLTSVDMGNAVGSATITFVAPLYTKTPSRTATGTSTPTDTVTPTDTSTETPSHTLTPSKTFTRTPSNTPTATNTPTVTNTASATATATPTSVSSALRKAVVGAHFTLALLQDDTLATWGAENRHGETIIPPALKNMRFKDVAACVSSALALTVDGRVYGWGENVYGEATIPVFAQSGIKAITGGGRFVLAIRDNGTVVAWGRNDFRQTEVPANLRDVIAIAAGDRHAVALKSDGTVVAWGDGRAGQTRVPPGLRNVIKISAGENHTLALLDNGRVVGWGANDRGQISIPATLRDVVHIGAGRRYSVAAMLDGTITGWGSTDKGVRNFPPRLDSVVVIGVAHINTVIGLRDGTIISIGDPEFGGLVSRTPTRTSMPTLTASETLPPTDTLTPSNTKTLTPSITLTRSRTPTRTR